MDCSLQFWQKHNKSFTCFDRSFTTWHKFECGCVLMFWKTFLRVSGAVIECCIIYIKNKRKLEIWILLFCSCICSPCVCLKHNQHFKTYFGHLSKCFYFHTGMLCVPVWLAFFLLIYGRANTSHSRKNKITSLSFIFHYILHLYFGINVLISPEFLIRNHFKWMIKTFFIFFIFISYLGLKRFKISINQLIKNAGFFRIFFYFSALCVSVYEHKFVCMYLNFHENVKMLWQ